MKKTAMKLLAGVSALAVLLAACGGNTTTTAPGTDGTEPGQTTSAGADPTDPPTGEPGEKVTITLMQSKTEIQERMQTVVDDFNAKHENIEVTLLGTSGDNYATVLQSNFAADPANAPTIFSIAGVDSVSFEDYFLSLDDTEAAKILSEGLKPDFTNDAGEIVGLPSAVEGYGFIYNVDMFNDAGIDPASLTDIPSFVAALETLSAVDGVVSPIGFAQENYFIFVHFFNWAIALADDYQAEIAKVNSGEQKLADIPSVQAWADALDLIRDYTNKGQASYDEQVAGFGQGQYAMIHQGNWAQSVLQDNDVAFDYAFLPYPLEGNTGLAVGPATAWRINNRSSAEQQEAAKTFLDWLITSDDGQTHSADLLDFIPAYQNVKAPAGGLSQSVAEFVSENETVAWAYNSVFPTGIDIDGARLMQEYYAGGTSADLLEQLNTVWVDLAN